MLWAQTTLDNVLAQSADANIAIHGRAMGGDQASSQYLAMSTPAKASGGPSHLPSTGQMEKQVEPLDRPLKGLKHRRSSVATPVLENLESLGELEDITTSVKR